MHRAKNYSTSALSAVFLFMTIIPGISLYAGEASTVAVSLDYASQYIWRGQVPTDDPVFQPGVSIAVGDFTASLWGNMDLTSVNNEKGQLTEVDYSLDYAGEVSDILGYSVGIIYYDFPALTNDAGTTEVYAGVSLNTILNPSVTVYRDIDDIKGLYIALGVSYSVDKIWQLSDDVTVSADLSAGMGWGNKK